MRHISSREANQRFSKLLAEVADGEEIVITRRGKPVARLCPVAGQDDAERAAAIKRMIARMTRGVDLGGIRVSRDEMHER